MLPIEALMSEHRLIERIISHMRKELAKMEESKEVNSKFVNIAVDFIRVYADRCHHGKEEGVLFRELSNKPMVPEYAKMMRELINEHVFARKTTGKLAQANLAYIKGDRSAYIETCDLMKALIQFYPMHIEKEDKKFFGPSMEYLTSQERERMLKEFEEFDRKIIHEHYAKVLDDLENLA